MYKNDNIKVYSRMLDGKYPDMKGIFGKVNNSTEIKVNKEEMLKELAIANNVGFDNDKKIIVVLNENKLEVLGDNNYESQIVFENNKEFTMKVMLDVLEQGIKNINGELQFNVVYDANSKSGTMIFLESEKELILLLGIR